jgi:hypothetical protein
VCVANLRQKSRVNFSSTKVDAGRFKRKYLNRPWSTLALNVLIVKHLTVGGSWLRIPGFHSQLHCVVYWRLHNVSRVLCVQDRFEHKEDLDVGIGHSLFTVYLNSQEACISFLNTSYFWFEFEPS